jgi:hypothetical protein
MLPILFEDFNEEDIPHWFAPFVQFVTDVETDTFDGGITCVKSVTLQIPAHLYDWEGIDIEALKANGISNLSVAKKGIQHSYDIKTGMSEGVIGFAYWEIDMSFKNHLIFINEEKEKGDMDNRKHVSG